MTYRWFTRYSLDTGEISGTFMADSETVAANLGPDMGAIEGEFSERQGYVADGAFAAYTPEQAALKQQRPTPGHQWCNRTMAWIDRRPLEVVWSDVRQRRDTLLQRSDWTALPDVPMSLELRGQWAAYRQALRDITSQPDPSLIVWPTPPA